MKEFWLFLGALVLWIVLNRWVLPRFGIRTCISGGCAMDGCPSCDPGPWKQSNTDVLEPKGNQE
jgi:hypothetical protein